MLQFNSAKVDASGGGLNDIGVSRQHAVCVGDESENVHSFSYYIYCYKGVCVDLDIWSDQVCPTIDTKGKLYKR